jgi:cytochrome c oxidase assembly protein subunit 15
VQRASYAVLGLTLLVIVWGAFVRASGSGAGCGSHWPMCNGEVVPRAPSVETAIELTHRVTSALDGVAVLALAIAAFVARPRKHPFRRWAVASLIFIVIEGAIGAALVKLELVGENASAARAGVIALHLVNTFLLVGAQTMTALTAPREPRRMTLRENGTPAWIVGLALLGTLLVGVTGAITALGDTLFPARTLAEGLEQDVAIGAHFLIRLRVWHPVIAVIVGLFTVAGAAIVATVRPDPIVKRAALLVAILFVGQIAGGFVNLLLLAPTWMQLVHLLMADVVWIALIALGARALEPHSSTAVVMDRAPSPAE